MGNISAHSLFLHYYIWIILYNSIKVNKEWGEYKFLHNYIKEKDFL